MREVLDLLERLKHDPEADQGAGPRFVRGFGETILRAALSYIEANRDAVCESTPEAARVAPLQRKVGTS
jgi:hypothetical protein